MSWYRTRLERDLKRWQQAGLVTEAGAAGIRADLAKEPAGFGAASIFALLGAVLFGFAVMSFVAAHWTAMSKLARLGLLLATLWACYGGAAVLMHRKLEAFAHAAILGGIAVYGASIMLIAQMYHMEGNPPDAVLLWALGALVAAVLARSRAALAAAFVLISVWTGYERVLSDTPHWPFLAGWAATTATAAWLAWRPGLHLAAISLIAWLVPIGYFVLGGHAHWIVVLIGGALALASVLAAPALDRHLQASAAALSYGLVVAFAGLFLLQFADTHMYSHARETATIQRLILLAVLSLGVLLAGMLRAIQTDNRAALWLAYAGFAVEIFALYVRTLGTLLNTSLFFLVAAIIVSLLAALAYRLHQRKAPAAGAPA